MPAKSDPYSYLKIFRHAGKLEAIRNKEVTAPLYVRIKPINVCNHHCFYCSYDDQNLGLRSTFRTRDKLTRELILDLIRDLADMKVKAVTFSGGGEPLLFEHIAMAMRAVVANEIDLSIITNGQLLCDDRAEVLRHAKWVRISMDSCSAAQYAKIRKIPEKYFNQVCANVRAFANNKLPACELGINYVITPENADEVYAMVKFARDLGVNHIKLTAMITKDLDQIHAPIKASVIEQIARAKREFPDKNFRIINKYEDDFELNAVFKRTYTRCPIQQIITVVGADAKVYFCHDKAYVPGGDFGDLTKTSFKELWFSEATRQRFLNFNAEKECCHHCVYDQRNIFINNFLDLDDSQVNFV